MQVSELIVRYLERLGIRQLFGIPGAHVLPIYDHLYHSSIHSILTKHEQGASFMAGGVARVSGQVSACIATAGPGATNLVTGIANAYADRLPVLAVTGEAPTSIFGKGGLQESSGEGGSINQNTLFSAITRYHKLIRQTDELLEVLTEATTILLSDQPGPVVLSLPYNLQKEEVDATILDRITFPPQGPLLPPPNRATNTFSTLIQQAKKTVILAGHGAIHAGREINQLCELFNIEVTTTLKGKGVISEYSPYFIGSLGVTSDGNAYRTITEEADLLIILGASFNERTSYLWSPELLQEKKLIQVDHNPAQLEKVFSATLAIKAAVVPTLRAVLTQLQQPLSASPLPKPSLSPPPSESPILRSTPPLIQQFFAQLERHFVDEPLSLFDDNIIYGQNLFRASPSHHYLPNSGISSLGHAIPAAIGASLLNQHPTFALLGDGGFQMCALELMTAVNYNIPINVVLLNNGAMGLIRKYQFQQYEGRYIDCDFINPDFALLARAFGISHFKIDQEAELRTLFTHCDLYKGINLIEIPIDKNAFPDYQSGR